MAKKGRGIGGRPGSVENSQMFTEAENVTTEAFVAKKLSKTTPSSITSTSSSSNSSSRNKQAFILNDEHFDSTDSVDFDEISTKQIEKAEAFRRIASAEEIEEMSDEVLENYIDLSTLSPERRAVVEQELNEELQKTEEEIQTLRQVLTAKIKHANEIKRRLGITVWKEFTTDVEAGFKNIQETTAYQKTTEAVKAASEKTTSVIGAGFGSLTRKLGEVKNSNAFKSFEERVGYAVTNVKSKIGSRSNSTHNFDDALRASEATQQPPVTTPTIPEEKPLP